MRAARDGERERSELVSAVRDHEMRKEGEATRVAGLGAAINDVSNHRESKQK